MAETSLLCFAHGRDRQWEAICVDLDISVTGTSLDDVRSLLTRAVDTYLEDVKRESPQTQKELLARRAPIMVELGLLARMSISAVLQLFHRQNRRPEFEARFTIPCHA